MSAQATVEARPVILLFKEPKAICDPWQTQLEAAGYSVVFQQLLQVEYLDADRIHDAFQHDLASVFSGVIVTSQHAVHALRRYEQSSLAPHGFFTRLCSAPCFTVGGATAATLMKFGFTTVQGQEAGTAQKLGHLIVDQFQSKLGSSAPTSRFLFVCGEPRRDELPTILRSASIDVHEIIVYRSSPIDLSAGQIGCLSSSTVAVFFSPAGVAAVCSAIEVRTALQHLQIVALGPTPPKGLFDHGFHSVSILTEPSPGALCGLLIAG